MSVTNLLSLIGVKQLLDEFPISLIWEKLEMAVNITEIKCPVKINESQSHDCVFKQIENIHNFISTAIEKHDVNLFSDDDKFTIMNTNKAIFYEIAKKVDKKMLTYMFNGNYTGHDLAASNQIDIENCLPCQYNEKVLESVYCTRSLYLSNEISILSTVDRIDEYDLTSMLKVYNWDTWIIFIAILFILISISSIKTTLWHSFWSFIYPLFDQENTHPTKSFAYIFYLVALIPFLEIIRNELLVKLVAVKEKSCDTIDDLIDPKVKVYSFIDINYLKGVNKNVGHAQLKQKLEKLFNKIGETKDVSDWIELIQKPQEIKKVGRNYAMIESEYAMNWIQKSFERNCKVHRGSQNLYPKLISDFCYKKSFKWKKLADKMSLRFFETGLHDYFHSAKVTYTVRATIKFLKFFEEFSPDMLELLYLLIKDESKDTRNVTSLRIDELKSAFSLYGYSLGLCAFILIFEGLNFFIDCLMQR